MFNKISRNILTEASNALRQIEELNKLLSKSIAITLTPAVILKELTEDKEPLNQVEVRVGSYSMKLNVDGTSNRWANGVLIAPLDFPEEIINRSGVGDISRVIQNIGDYKLLLVSIPRIWICN